MEEKLNELIEMFEEKIAKLSSSSTVSNKEVQLMRSKVAQYDEFIMQLKKMKSHVN